MSAHGAAGLFIMPDKFLASCRPGGARPGPRRGTALHHAHLAHKEFETIARSLAEGVGVNSTARIQEVDKKTVLKVLARAAKHVEAVSRSFKRGLTVLECQMDEMWSFIGKKEANLDVADVLGRIEGLGDAWIWIAFDAVNKVVIADEVGKRTLPHALALLREVKRVTKAMPRLFSSDQLEQYKAALLRIYGRPSSLPRETRLVPPDDLLYVQVVKEYGGKGNRLRRIHRRIVFGSPERVQSLLEQSPTSSTINTSYVERNNANVRHADARCNRKTYRFSKCKRNHVWQLKLCLAYYHFCRPHLTLSKRHGRPTTPFMAAGVTDHVWTMGELLQARVDDQ